MIKSIIFIILCAVGVILLFIFFRRLLNHWRYERSQTLSIIVDLAVIALSILVILFFGFCLVKNMITSNSNDVNENKATITSSITTTTNASSTILTTTSFSAPLTSSNTTVTPYKTRTIKTTAKTTSTSKKKVTRKQTNTTRAYITSAYNTVAPAPIQTTKHITTTTTKKITRTAKPSKRVTTTKVTTTAYIAENAYSSELLSLINKYRKASGITKLKPMIELDKVAYQRAKEIAENYSHTRPNGYAAQSLLKDYGLSYSRFGENLGAGSKTSEQVFKEWHYSPVNNANILNSNYKYVGSAYYYYPDDPSGRHFYWVQVFYTP